MLVVCLVEKHVFPVTTFCCPFFKNALFADAVFGA
jgi:hypothetical protein